MRRVHVGMTGWSEILNRSLCWRIFSVVVYACHLDVKYGNFQAGSCQNVYLII